MKEQIKGTKAVAQKIVAAREWLVNTLSEAGSISIEDANKIADHYIKHGIVKLDLQMSKYKFNHGAFLESETIKNAIKLINEN